MKDFFYLIKQFVPILCIVGSILLAYNGIGGWGWFLVIALMTYK